MRELVTIDAAELARLRRANDDFCLQHAADARELRQARQDRTHLEAAERQARGREAATARQLREAERERTALAAKLKAYDDLVVDMGVHPDEMQKVAAARRLLWATRERIRFLEEQLEAARATARARVPLVTEHGDQLPPSFFAGEEVALG